MKLITRPAFGGHRDDLGRARAVVEQAGFPMQRPDQFHFQRHIAVIGNIGLVDAKRQWNATRAYG